MLMTSLENGLLRFTNTHTHDQEFKGTTKCMKIINHIAPSEHVNLKNFLGEHTSTLA